MQEQDNQAPVVDSTTVDADAPVVTETAAPVVEPEPEIERESMEFDVIIVGGGGAAAAGGAAQTPQVSRDVVVQLTGGPMFTREQVAEFLTELNEYVEDGGNIRVV